MESVTRSPSPLPSTWSTPKVLAIALATTLATFFFGNLIFNELLNVDVPTWVFAGAAGLLMVPSTMRWSLYRNALLRRDR